MFPNLLTTHFGQLEPARLPNAFFVNSNGHKAGRVRHLLPGIGAWSHLASDPKSLSRLEIYPWTGRVNSPMNNMSKLESMKLCPSCSKRPCQRSSKEWEGTVRAEPIRHNRSFKSSERWKRRFLRYLSKRDLREHEATYLINGCLFLDFGFPWSSNFKHLQTFIYPHNSFASLLDASVQIVSGRSALKVCLTLHRSVRNFSFEPWTTCFIIYKIH